MTTSDAARCSYDIRGYSIGRNVIEQRQCRRLTTHPTGLCYQHRSDTDEDYDR